MKTIVTFFKELDMSVRFRKPQGMRTVPHPLLVIAAMLTFVVCASAQAQQKKPNIVVIFGDDIGMWNISAYSRGMMGYRTPNIDRLAKEGALFTDLYAQQ